MRAVLRLLYRAATLAALFPVFLYRTLLSPLTGGSCRFNPTCSVYAERAILRHGPLVGWALAVRRVLRCHPFNPGGDDPVP
ncbi:MAG: membrane protein insertion efficiency factor YidD [Planctomycetota bacterium]|nr:MAG: membrane protein insertion efficiency factor YidD [Planctomycetota bacterium]